MIKDSRYIFGAKATAVGLYKALIAGEQETEIDGFVVTDKTGNCEEILGRPVLSLDELSSTLSTEEKQNITIYVAVPELIHKEVSRLLTENGFLNMELINSRKEAAIMEAYYEREGIFTCVHTLQAKDDYTKLTVYAATFYKDKPLSRPPIFPEYVKKIFLGCSGARTAGVNITGQADFYDDMGDNISDKNPNRCEMTAHYWIWKNRLNTDDDYVGVCHYRRLLDLDDEDLKRIKVNDVDVVLPFPMMHYPNATIQHSWYIPEDDWIMMRRVLKELQPAYEERFEEVFNKPYFYNYNMLIAKKEVFANYCAWIYPILDRIEELSDPKGDDRQDRYTAYLSESLETLYFMANLNGLKIYHTGRMLFT